MLSDDALSEDYNEDPYFQSFDEIYRTISLMPIPQNSVEIVPLRIISEEVKK